MGKFGVVRNNGNNCSIGRRSGLQASSEFGKSRPHPVQEHVSRGADCQNGPECLRRTIRCAPGSSRGFVGRQENVWSHRLKMTKRQSSDSKFCWTRISVEQMLVNLIERLS